MACVRFLRGFPKTREFAELQCSEAVAAYWNSAVSALGRDAHRSVRAYLREALLEAYRGRPIAVETLASEVRHREALNVLLHDDHASPGPVGRDVWLLLEAAFEALRRSPDAIARRRGLDDRSRLPN